MTSSLASHIGEGAIDQLDDQMALVGFGMQRVGVIPVERLRGGGMVVAPRTAEALGADAQIDDPAQDGQMAQQARLVHAVALGDGAPTAAASRAGQGAFDGEDELARLGQLGLEDADIGDIERDRDERLLGHRGLPSSGRYGYGKSQRAFQILAL